jgi:hypothetical protein
VRLGAYQFVPEYSVHFYITLFKDLSFVCLKFYSFPDLVVAGELMVTILLVLLT